MATGYHSPRVNNLQIGEATKNSIATGVSTDMGMDTPEVIDADHVYPILHAQQRLLLTPLEIYLKAVHSGQEKSKMVWWKTMILSIVAGGYVGLGGSTAYLVGGALNQAPGFADASQHNYGIYKLIFGAFGFPLAFLAIVSCGAELFTATCTYTFCAFMEGHIPLTTVVKMLSITWIGNFIGCVFVAWLFFEGETFKGHEHTIVLTTNAKLQLDDKIVFIRALFANWFVAVATWMSNAALDYTGKAVGVFIPIFSFGAIGFEHCIANMYVVIQGCLEGADCTAGSVMKNIMISTVGNWIGGVGFCALPYCLVYGRPIWKMTKERLY